MTTFEAAAKIVEDLSKAHAKLLLHKGNEATTRLRVIDRVLFDVLGWDRDCCLAEDPVKGQDRAYLDYALTDGKKSFLVVEAKRAGKTFHIPAEVANKTYRVDTLLGHCGDALKEVLEQARGYAVDKGIPFAAATNGSQWIVFKPFLIHQDWKAGTAIVFRSLEEIGANLPVFLDTAGKDAVLGGRLDAKLSIRSAEAPKFARTYNEVRGHDGGREQNHAEKDLNTFFKYTFDAITGDKETLERCYVSTEMGRNYEREFSALLHAATPHALRGSADAGGAEGASQDFSDAVAVDNEPSVILLVGNVGSGKTTFLHHYLRVFAPKNVAGTLYWVIQDLIDEPMAAAAQLDAHAAEERIIERLLDTVEKRFPDIDPFGHNVLRRVFSKELARLARGPRQREFENDATAKTKAEADLLDELSRNRRGLVLGLLRYVREEKGAPLTVAFDNVDQASEAYQRFIYAFAHGLTQDGECNTVITLRQSVFEIARENSFLDIRNDRVFLISPPSLQHVISKRIKHARGLLDAAKSKNSKLAKVDTGRIAGYVEVINELFLGESQGCRRFVEALSGGNVRKAFSYLQRYATSSHVDISSLINTYNKADARGTRPALGLRDFLRPFVLGNLHRYHRHSSPLVNLFDASQFQRVSHFHRLRVLSYLADRFKTSNESARGETEVTDVVAAMAMCGHGEGPTVQVCGELHKLGLVECLSTSTRAITRTDVIRIAAAGMYYLTELIFDEDYLFFVCQDTVLYHQDSLNRLERDLRNVEMRKGQRRAAVEDFIEYLGNQEAQERTAIGPPRSPVVPWDRMFSSEIGWRVIGGPKWETLRVPPPEDVALSGESAVHAGNGQQLLLGMDGLGADDQDSNEKRLAEVEKSFPPLLDASEVAGSRQLARVIWALRLAQLANLPPQTAAGVARLVLRYGKLPVQATNVARFFRTHLPRHRELFVRVRPGVYTLSSEGGAAFTRNFEHRRNAQVDAASGKGGQS